MHDPARDEFRVLVAQGAISPRVSDMVTLRGRGVAGVVMSTRLPFTTADYLHDIFFIAKMALFVAIGLMSIYPTRQFLRMRPVLRQGGTPAIDPAHLRRIRRVIHIEATLVVLMILCASLMAHGIGLIGD